MGTLFIRISVIYLFIGTVLGMYMSMTNDFALSSVHTHISLLGWTTMTLAGIIYYIFQDLGKSMMCKIQFILYNIGLPVMMLGLAFLTKGFQEAVIAVSIGAMITSIAILLFTIHILFKLNRS